MKLETLLRTLSEDDHPPARSVKRQLAIAGALGLLVSSALVLGMAGARPDWTRALLSFDVQVKSGAALLLVGASFLALREAVQPTAMSTSTLIPLLLAPLLAVVGVCAQLLTSSPGHWLGGLLGTHPEMCVMMVPLLSIPALAFVLYAMRNGAARSPAQAGALAGLFCGGLGASAYMLRCTDDAPLFLVTWYGAAVLVVAGVGAVLGRRLLHW